MNEQQRVFLTVISCMAIFLAWQYFFLPPSANETVASQSATAAPQPSSAAPLIGQVSDANGVAAVNAATPIPTTPEESRDFSSAQLRGTLSNRAAALTALDLVQYNERTQGDAPPKAVSLVPTTSGLGQARIDWDLAGAAAPELRFVNTTDGFQLVGRTAQGLDLAVDVRLGKQPYALDYVVRAHNTANTPLPAGVGVTLALTPTKEDKKFLAPPSDQLHAVCNVSGSIERKQNDDVSKGAWVAAAPVQWTALDRQYFVAAVVPEAGASGGCAVSHSPGDLLAVRFSFPTEMLPAGGSSEKKFTLYLGPKHKDYLQAIGADLPDVLDYTIWHIPMGVLAKPMVSLLNLFHGISGSWGIAIIMLTFLVKALLFPFTYKSIVSMRKMQLLKPDLDRIKKQFENDRERQQLEQLKLFKDKGVNPLGGCLPMLLQMPVWFALYRTLWSAVDLYQQPFLWLPDLTAKEPYPILAIVLGALTVLQQKMTPMAADNEQAKIMMVIMPVMLTVFMIALPSGLVLYILVNSILTIVQQLAINKRAVAL